MMLQLRRFQDIPYVEGMRQMKGRKVQDNSSGSELNPDREEIKTREITTEIEAETFDTESTKENRGLKTKGYKNKIENENLNDKESPTKKSKTSSKNNFQT